MTSWDPNALIATFLTLDDIARKPTSKPQGKANETTPVLTAASEARSKGYEALCIPLTTEHWKKRWTEMCLLPNDAERDVAAEKCAEAWRSRPGFLKDEVTMTRLGKWVGLASDKESEDKGR